MSSSWIEKKISKDQFITTENKEYNFEDFYNLLIQYYKFAKENTSYKEKICFISSDVMQYAIFSILIPMVGGVFVPLNPKSPIKEIKNKMDLIDSKKIVHDENLKLEKIKNIICLKSEKQLTKSYNFCWPNQSDTICILFTSGSSGEPKPVELSLSNLESSCNNSQINLKVTNNDKWLLCMPPYHAGGISIIFRSLILGKKLYIQNSFDANSVIDLIINSKVSIISLVPTMLLKIVEIMEKNKISAPKDFNFILCGGAKVEENLIERALKSRLKIIPTYGMTEASSQIATADPSDNKRPLNSVGKLLNGINIKFSHQNEILINGPSIARYYKTTTQKWLATGDYGYLDDEGYLFVEGRLDDLIISGGENINPLEIQKNVNNISNIKESYVFGSNDDYWGQRVNLAVVFKENTFMTLGNINKELGKLDKFKLPKKLYILEKSLPKLINGKIDKKYFKKLTND